MLLRKYAVSTGTLLQLTVAVVFLVVGGGAAVAAGSGNPPLLVPYTIQTIAGTPQYASGKTTLVTGYGGDGGLSVPVAGFCDQLTSPGTAGCPTLNTPYGVAVDSVGNVYITDTANDIIREVNGQTGVINTIAGAAPKGCSGYPAATTS